MTKLACHRVDHLVTQRQLLFHIAQIATNPFNHRTRRLLAGLRLRLLFPTGAASIDSARADTAFDVITRPARIAVPETIRNESPVSSMPMISMVDAGDAETGATVIGKGLMEYEIVGEVTTYNAEHAELAE